MGLWRLRSGTIANGYEAHHRTVGATRRRMKQKMRIDENVPEDGIKIQADIYSKLRSIMIM
jgi:hypothetical protein